MEWLPGKRIEHISFDSLWIIFVSRERILYTFFSSKYACPAKLEGTESLA